MRSASMPDVASPREVSNSDYVAVNTTDHNMYALEEERIR